MLGNSASPALQVSAIPQLTEDRLPTAFLATATIMHASATPRLEDAFAKTTPLGKIANVALGAIMEMLLLVSGFLPQISLIDQNHAIRSKDSANISCFIIFIALYKLE